MKSNALKLTTAALALSLGATTAFAGDSWYPFKVMDATNGVENRVEATYSPLEKAEKPLNICVLFPHLKDSIWLAINYGIAKEAERLGVNMTLFEAGGYANLPRQLAQFDDCLAGGYDAIVAGVISEGGLAQKLKEANEAGIPVVAVLNVIAEAPIAGRVYPDIPDMTKVSAQFMADMLGGNEGKVVTFPGPAGSGWAELFNDHFKGDIAEHGNVEVIGERFGDSGVAVQLGLIQDALQSYPEMNAMYGGAPAVEAAVGALAAAGKYEFVMVPAYENDAIHFMVESGELPGFVTQFPVAQGRVALDMAVRAVEGSLTMNFVNPIPEAVDSATLKATDKSVAIAAPKGFSATYQVNVTN